MISLVGSGPKTEEDHLNTLNISVPIMKCLYNLNYWNVHEIDLLKNHSPGMVTLDKINLKCQTINYARLIISCGFLSMTIHIFLKD